MKIVCISDTHNKHAAIKIPTGDLIIHAGDFTEAGTRAETLNFLNWFSSLPHTHKILVAGNHDFFLEKNTSSLHDIIPPNIHYLQDSGVCIDHINFWGAPYTRGNGSWAFNIKRGEEIGKHWDLIPGNTNFLITHTPPFRILDELDNKKHIGCDMLRQRVKQINPAYHIFGHNHNDYGIERTAATVFVNSSSLDDNYRAINAPLVIHHKQS